MIRLLARFLLLPVLFLVMALGYIIVGTILSVAILLEERVVFPLDCWVRKIPEAP